MSNDPNDPTGGFSDEFAKIVDDAAAEAAAEAIEEFLQPVDPEESDDPVVVHDNDRYCVLIVAYDELLEYGGAKYDIGYAVLNKQTGVYEVLTAQLPDAIMAAEQLDIAMATKQWEWMRANLEAKAADGEPPIEETLH